MKSNFTEFDGENHQSLHTVEQRTIPARRATDTNLEVIAHKQGRIAAEFTEFKTEVREAVRDIKNANSYTHATLHEATERAKAAAETAELSVKKAVQEAMAAAFPDGDPDGHRRHHEVIIEREKEKSEFYKKLKLELTKYGLFGFLGWAAYALWTAFLAGPRK